MDFFKYSTPDKRTIGVFIKNLDCFTQHGIVCTWYFFAAQDLNEKKNTDRNSLQIINILIITKYFNVIVLTYKIYS